jgi:glycosyltransferase involved in cell wall biosynthesis
MHSSFPEKPFEVTGFLPYRTTIQRLSACDLLVLPSNGKEGWGAVINEALMCGVPVVCSARCGASDLIKYPCQGEIFKTGSPQALANALRSRIAQGKPLPELRDRIREWSGCIRGESGAEYFLNLLEHVYGELPRPKAPWRIASFPLSDTK